MDDTYHYSLNSDSCLSAYLARRVDLVSRKFLSTVFDRFAECVLDTGMMSLDKYTLQKSHLGLGPQDRLITQKASQRSH